MRTVLLLSAIGLMVVGCDKVDNPIEQNNDSSIGGGTVKRRALLEEFTGHHCITCPAAHLVGAQLKSLYGDKLIIASIHAIANYNSSFIAPQSNPDGSYATDFRTPEGQDYAAAFGIAGFIPQGLVNRTSYDNSVPLSSASWGEAVEVIVNQDAELDIWIDTLVHNPSANTVSATVKVAVLAPITGEHKITTYLLEDHVIDWQYSALATPNDVPNYDHRHVFRKTLDGAWGQVAIVSSAEAGDTLTFVYSDVVMNPAWVASECELISYVYRVDNEQILQAAERKFQP